MPPLWIQEWPFKLAKLLDPDIDLGAKLSVARRFLEAKECCLDKAFSLRLQRSMKDSESLLLCCLSCSVLLGYVLLVH